MKNDWTMIEDGDPFYPKENDPCFLLLDSTVSPPQIILGKFLYYTVDPTGKQFIKWVIDDGDGWWREMNRNETVIAWKYAKHGIDY